MSKYQWRFMLNYCQYRQITTKMKIVPELKAEVHEEIKKEKMNPKKHPGVFRILPKKIPEQLYNSVLVAVQDQCLKTLFREGVILSRYLKERHPPPEEDTTKEKLRMLKKNVESKLDVDKESLSPEELSLHRSKVKARTIQLFNKTTYNWKPVTYNGHSSLVYLLARVSPEYAVLCRIFNEIASRDKEFKPNTILDFGCGVGTVTWAARTFWNDSLKEFFCIDCSSHMLNLAQLLVQGKRTFEQPAGFFYRQFLPSQNLMYDLVVSAYTLFELPTKQTRLEIILNLWNKTNQYLVLVDYGSNSGFKLITEARDFILFSNTKKGVDSCEDVHVFAPCPHDVSCPRLVEDATPCNFQSIYFSPALGEKGEHILKERFSFVVLKKGRRSDNEAGWPRIVRPVLKLGRQSICRCCTAEGKLQELIFTPAKNGQIPYRCARSSRWGDLLPVKLSEIEVEKKDYWGKNAENECEENDGDNCIESDSDLKNNEFNNQN